MILIGRYLSPFTRRVAVSLKVLGIPFERRALTAWQDLDAVRSYNPAGRVPALVLDDGDTIFESSAILDEIDRMVGPDKALVPAAGAQRRAALRTIAVALGAMEKGAAARYELVMRPEEKIHRPWVEHNLAQAASALDWLEAQFDAASGSERMTQEIISTVVAYDFLKIALPDHLDLAACPGLEGLSRTTGTHLAFAETRPELDQ